VDTRGALTRLWDHLKKGQKQRLYGWFQEWADIEAQATVLRWYEPLVVPACSRPRTTPARCSAPDPTATSTT
jgi:hypothetical protein